MPTSTPNLSLYKYNTNTDGNMTFNITNSLNNNWDKIDTYCKNLSDNKADKSAVNSALALKADTSAVNSALALKADLTDLDTKANITQLHALKGYEDAGELLTDAEGLNDVIKYAHSTFDLSKFAVVGNPNITNDGIASGFSANNVIRLANTYDVGSYDTWMFKGEFTTDDLENLSGNKAILYMNAGYGKGLGFNQYKQLYLNLNSTNTNNYDIASQYVDKSTITLTANTRYYYRFYFTGTQYLVDISTDKITWTNYITVTNSTHIWTNSSTAVYIGNSALQYAIATFSFDLKEFEFIANGIPVFSGNKTGIDTIKPDDYTESVDAIVSNDGVLSYSTVTSSLSNTPTTIRFEGEVHIGSSTTSGAHSIIKIGGVFMSINYATKNVGLNNQWIGQGSFAYNKTYKFIAEATATTLDLWWGEKGTTLTKYEKTATVTFDTDISIGDGTVKDNCIFDLNLIKVYDNGLVYQPCLKIPYTKGSEQYGGKYVNAQYLPRVKDAYEQGLANDYFTLDEVNGTYTLPMGNLYGMFEPKNKWVYADQTNAISTATAIGTYDLTSAVTSVLPVDSDSYECLFRYTISRQQTGGGTNTNYTVTVSSNIVLNEAIDSAATSGSNDTNPHGGQFTAIIDKTRAMSLNINSQALNTNNLFLVAYRKVN